MTIPETTKKEEVVKKLNLQRTRLQSKLEVLTRLKVPK